jgi:GT2 family glycosyltransferase
MIDNDSSDDSVAWTREHYPQVNIFETGNNYGFSSAYNLSFQHANGKYYLLLNNDTTVEPDWLEPMVEACESDPEVGAVQPKLVSMIEEGYFEYAGSSGGFLDKYGFPFLRGRVVNVVEKDEGQYDDAVDVFWTCGAAMFVRADALEKTGGLDEDFRFHMEEIDLCYRLHLMGYRLRAIPSSKIYHYAGATIKPDSLRKMYFNHRNSLFMMMKNLEARNLFSLVVTHVLIDYVAFAVSFLKLQWLRCWSIMKAHLWLIFHFGLVLRKRKEVQQMRTVGDDVILGRMHPKSIVWQFFAGKKHTYKQLVEDLK